MSKYKIFRNDCLEVINSLKNNVVDLTVTSPPYDNIRDYNKTLYWNRAIWEKVIKELWRVTKNRGGSCMDSR